jgi:hypothetical protein
MSRLLIVALLGMTAACSFNNQGHQDVSPTPPVPGNAPPIPIIPFLDDAGLAEPGDSGAEQDAGSPIHQDAGAIAALDASALDASPTTLATNQNQARSLVAENGQLYWTDFGVAEIMTESVDGGSPTVLLSSQPAFALAVDTNALYWTNNADAGTVSSLPLDGGSVSVLASNQNQPFAITSNGSDLYWLTLDAVMHEPLDGGTAVAIANTTQTIANNLTLDTTYLYWSSGSADASIYRAPLNGGTVETIATNQANPTSVVVDNGVVFWANYGDSTIIRSSLNGSASTILTTGGATYSPWDLMISGGNLYFTMPAAGLVGKVAEDGSGVSIIASGQDRPYSLAFDRGAVYWTNYDVAGEIVSLTN